MGFTHDNHSEILTAENVEILQIQHFAHPAIDLLPRNPWFVLHRTPTKAAAPFTKKKGKT